MNESGARPSEPSAFRAPLILFWTGLLIRVLYITFAHTYRFSPFEDHFTFGYEMARVARALVTGYGYADPFSGHTGPTAWVPPLYPLLIAAVFKLAGVYTLKSPPGFSSPSTAFSPPPPRSASTKSPPAATTAASQYGPLGSGRSIPPPCNTPRAGYGRHRSPPSSSPPSSSSPCACAPSAKSPVIFPGNPSANGSSSHSSGHSSLSLTPRCSSFSPSVAFGSSSIPRINRVPHLRGAKRS